MIWWQWQLGISEMGGGAEVEHAIPKGTSSSNRDFRGLLIMLNFVGVLIINLRDHVGCGEVWSNLLEIVGVHASLLKLY